MAEFQIWSSDGQTVRATGSPVYNGTFLKPGYLEFQEIGSPVPIGLAAGDYVDYPRTGLRYKLYNTPKVLKQGERNRYGGAFVYENVQFFDITKELEIAPFIDLVPFDNLIHFSTRNSVAFYGTPANVAERIQACLEYWFPTSGWVVDVISGLDPEDDAELIETLATETDFSVSGISCLGALDRVYELWNGLGWSYGNTGGVNRITIGAPNKRTAGNTTASYGRINDNGLVTLARSVSNAEEMGTRLYAYGSMRNMPTDYYRSKDIKDAESVDIAHLMLPIDPVASLDYDGWGETDGLPDARLAYIEDADAIAKYGLIPRYAYFDGSDSEYPDIYPSLSGVTIGDVIDGKEQMSDTSYVPDLTKWSRGDRVDEIVSAVNPADNGGASAGGSQYSESGTFATTPATIDTSISGSPVEEIIGNFSPIAPSDTLYMTLDLSGTVSISGSADSSWFEMRVRVEGVSPTSNASSEVLVPLIDIGEDDRFAFSLEGVSFDLNLPGMTSVRVYFHVEKTGWELLDCEVSVNAGSVFLGWSSSLGRTFKATIPQIGFNILQYADMGGGKTLSMLTGMCAGRGFPIKAASYDASNDAWVLTLGRVKDSDTGLWYPNSDFQVAQGDQYVLLDIAMPELYIAMASIRLLKAAQRLLGAISEESPFYEPDIDSKKVVGESRVLKAGMWMHLIGDEIVDGGEDYSLIDTLRIDENASNIPVYEVTLRKRKPIEWTETSSGGSVEKPTSTPVDETVQQTSARPPDWFVVESYEEEGGETVTKQRLKLNPKYQGMYAEGWVSAGGLSDGGGGVVGDYLPLAGGDMTGSIRMIVGSSATYEKAYAFGHGSGSFTYDGYLTGDSGGNTWLYGRSEANIMAGYGSDSGRLRVTKTDVLFNGTSLLGSQYVLPVATANNLGGIKIGYTQSGKNYPVLLDSNNKAYVYVPWQSGSGGSTVVWGTTVNNKSTLTVDGTPKTVLLDGWSPDLSAYATTAAMNTALAGYLPLTAGSGNKLTGILYINPTGASDQAIKIISTTNSGAHAILFTNSNESAWYGRIGANTSTSVFQLISGEGCSLLLRTGGSSSSGFSISAPSSNRYSITPGIAGTVTVDGTTGALTALNNGMDIGTSSYYVRRIFSKVIYLANNVWIYYDTTHNCIRTNAPIVSDSYISAGGISTT